MVGESGGEFGFQLGLGLGDALADCTILPQEGVGVVGFFLGGVGVLDVEVVDGPEVAVADGLLLAGLLAEGFDLGGELFDLRLGLAALGGVLFTFDGLAQVFDLVHQSGGVVVE